MEININKYVDIKLNSLSIVIGRDLQTRWKSLRDQFRKEVRATKTTHSGQSAPKKKKKYVYFDNLLFLLPTLDVKVTASNFVDNISRSETETTVQSDDTQVASPGESMPLHESPIDTTPAAVTKGNTRKRPRNVSSDVTEIREMRKLLSDSIALQSENKQKDTFGNKAFLMSLVPLLDAMSEEHMIDCRIRLMDTVRLYRSLRSNNNKPVQQSMPNASTSYVVQSGLQSPTPASDVSFQSQTTEQNSMSNIPTSYVLLSPSTSQPPTPASDVSFNSQITDSSQFDIYSM